MSSVVTFLLNLLPFSTSPFYYSIANLSNPPSYYKPSRFNESFKFPKGFLHGYATAATQIEGGITADGRGLSIWDPFSHHKGAVKDKSTTDVTCGSYELWEEDIKLLETLNSNVYRFSLSWSRIIPNGGRKDPVNEKGLQYYDRLIDGLLAKNITPFVTIHHWDVPLALQNRYESWLTPEEMKLDFVRFADLCFSRYGDRVKDWITINEPLTTTNIGYAGSAFPPGYNDNDKALQAGYGMLLAHAHTVDLYRRKYQPIYGGQIGISLCGSYNVPWSETEDSKEAASDKWDFNYGWFASPIFQTGDYPASMKSYFKDRLPTISQADQKLLRGSSDFFGVNTYWTYAIRSGGWHEMDAFTRERYSFANGTEFGWPIGQNGWRGVPWGLHDLVTHIHNKYRKPIYVTEFGFARKGEKDMSVQDAIEDDDRILFFQEALDALRRAVKEGVDLRGCMAWTLTDNWEWADGFNLRFGAAHTDTKTLKRTPKASGLFQANYFENYVAR